MVFSVTWLLSPSRTLKTRQAPSSVQPLTHFPQCWMCIINCSGQPVDFTLALPQSWAEQTAPRPSVRLCQAASLFLLVFGLLFHWMKYIHPPVAFGEKCTECEVSRCMALSSSVPSASGAALPLGTDFWFAVVMWDGHPVVWGKERAVNFYMFILLILLLCLLGIRCFQAMMLSGL